MDVLNRKWRLELGLTFVFLLLSLPGCKKQNMLQQASETSSGVIRVGEVGSMTGSDASFGISTHQGIALAISEINASGGIQGKKLELITMDDQGKPSEAVLAMHKLISQDHVHAILGEVASTISIAMAPIAQQNRVPMISPSSINSKLTQQGEYIFRICFVDQFQSQVLAEFATKNLHARKVAILQDMKSDYSRDSAAIFTEQFKKAGGQVVIQQSYSGGDIDFRSQLTAIRAAQPDLILVPGYYTEIGLIARQKKELGLDVPLLGGDGWDSPKLYEIGGSALIGSFFVSHFSQEQSDPLVQNFVQKYKDSYEGVVPNGLAALGYDAARLLADALKRSPSLSSDEIRTAISSTQGFQGVTGKISMGKDRNAQKSAIVFKISDGGRYKLETTVKPL